MNVKSDFASRLQEARRQRGMTQAELAKAAGLQQSTIGHFASGTRSPSLQNLRRLCVALDVSADHLLGLDREGGEAAAELGRAAAGLPEDDLELLRVLAEAMRKRSR